MRWAVLVLVGCAATQAPTTRSATQRHTAAATSVEQSAKPASRSTQLHTAPATSVDHANAAIDALVANNWPAVVAGFGRDSEPPTPSQVETTWREQTAGLGAPRRWTLVDRTY